MTDRTRPRPSARRRLTPWLAALALVSTVALAPAAVLADRHRALCETFPKVPWWGGLTHGKTIRYVLKDLNGDWQVHILQFEEVRDQLVAIKKKDGTAVVTNAATDERIQLRGARLDQYIADVGKRIEIIRCLARRHGQSYFREPIRKPRP